MPARAAAGYRDPLMVLRTPMLNANHGKLHSHVEESVHSKANGKQASAQRLPNGNAAPLQLGQPPSTSAKHVPAANVVGSQQTPVAGSQPAAGFVGFVGNPQSQTPAPLPSWIMSAHAAGSSSSSDESGKSARNSLSVIWLFSMWLAQAASSALGLPFGSLARIRIEPSMRIEVDPTGFGAMFPLMLSVSRPSAVIGHPQQVCRFWAVSKP